MLTGRCVSPAPPLPALSPPPAPPRPLPVSHCSALGRVGGREGGGRGSQPGGARPDDLHGDVGARPGQGLGFSPLPCGLPTLPPREAGPWETSALLLTALGSLAAAATEALAQFLPGPGAVQSRSPHLAGLIFVLAAPSVISDRPRVAGHRAAEELG